ncbi:MAG TPA: FAD-dependent oxidoreductase [Bryobacteraceae bacterium]|nr:FAD-dependent oxidoreductase [Bryobacteraceae bacterium]
MTRTVVGLRPFRPAGFRVEPETIGSKTVIHNYGHGGGGVSLSWGTSQIAVEHAIKAGHQSCAVLGSGAVGLATALLLQRHGQKVTMYTAALPPNTTSNISGAQWWPVSAFDHAAVTPAFREEFIRAARLSHAHFQTLLGADYGVRWLPNFVLSDEEPMNHFLLGPESPLNDLYLEQRDFGPRQHTLPAAYVRRFTSMMIEPPIYLRALLRDFRIAGGQIIVRKFAAVSDLASLSEPVIVNCTGLGSRELFGDGSLIPIKGQLSVLLPQPEVDYNLLKGGMYMFPRADGILLGGTFQRGDWSLDPDRDAEKRILAAHTDLFSRIV